MKTEFVRSILSFAVVERAKGLDYGGKRLFGVLSLAVVLLVGLCNSVAGQGDDQSNPRFTEGDINDSASLTFAVPMGSYKGRGLDLPISLNYSSDLWKMEHIGKVHNSTWIALTQSVNEAYYSKFKTSGWKSSLSLPIIEFPKSTSRYDCQGKASSSTVEGPGYRLSEVYIHMPDGSTHTLRKNDQPWYGNVDMTGTFYAVDGSRMRFDANGTADTGTIYMPDGTRYVLGHPTSYIIDRHGNTLTYDESTRTWTDTLGRQIANPLPATPTVGDVDYYLPGLAGVGTGQLKYTFKWKLLENALTPDGSSNPPPLRVVGSEALPNPYIPPSDSSNYPAPQSAGLGRLFQSTPPGYGTGGVPTVSGLIVGKGYYAGQLFNPVVLTEIVLPDGTSYKYSYNVYGEIDKVVYPTNAYDRYEHTGYPPSQYAYDCAEGQECEPDPQPYLQSIRWVSKRQKSADGTGNDLREWTYINAPVLNGGGTTKIIAPDKTRTEIVRYGPGPKTGATYGQGGQNFVYIYPFGFKDARVGMVQTKKFYSTSPDGLGGSMLRQEVFQYEQTTQNYTISANCLQPRTFALSRRPRLARQTNIIFEGSGDALAQSTTYQYDLIHQWDTGIDQTQAATYNYVVVNNATAQTGDLTLIPLGTLAKYSETAFSSDAGYQNANILGIPTISKIKDAAGTVVSQSEMSYDDPGYVPSGTNRALPTTMKTWDSTKGNYDNPSAYLLAHAKFDTYGNRTEATDAKGFMTVTAYDTTYNAFPVSVTTPVPDDDGSHGSNSAFTSTTSYDSMTGLVLSTTDVNGQTTTMEYIDPLLRPTKVTAPNGHQTITEYGLGTSEAERWVKVKTQIDAAFWSEAVSRYDGLGRTYKTEKIDSNGHIFSETEYDTMGRVKRSTNPYRSGETKQWTTPEYDDLSRTKKVISPDTDDVQIVYALSTTGVIGTTKTVIDQAGKKRTGITDALGNMVRVIEDPDNSAPVTDYVFDTLGNLRKTIQGEQSRYFMYDSLGRVLFAKQPEQDANTAFIATDPITGNTQWSVKYVYDDNRNIVTTTDARNISITGNYDRFNRLTFRDYSDSTPDVTFYYDGRGLGSIPNYSKGKTTRVSSTVSETRYTSFDSMGRLLASEQRTTAEQLAGTRPPYAFSYVYNLSGALIEETYPSTRVVKYDLNQDGELIRVQSKKAANHGFFTYADSFTYTSAGAVTKTQLGNGHWETASYNERLQVTQIGLGLTHETQNLLKLEFKYNTPGQTDNNGSMREQKITVPSVGTNPLFTATQSYIYDSLNRIQSATETINSAQTWKQTFAYDRYGNRRFDAANTTTLGGCAASVCNPDINTLDNRLTKDQAGGSSVDYDFDANGSLIMDVNGHRFGYDAESHQKEFFSASNQTSTPDATYHYDGEGRRVKKIVGSDVTIFVYDAGGQLAAEYSTTVVAVEQAKVSYLTTDHLGSPRIITDQNGAVSSRKDFAAFGDEVVSPQRIGGTNGNGYNPPNVRQDYTGYQKDSESGLEFAQARFYNTGHGRFTSVDPLTASATIRNPQTLNRYSYVMNSPYKFVDPLGLMAWIGPLSGIATGVCSAEVNNCDGSGNNELGSFPSRHPINTGHSFLKQSASSRPADGPPIIDIFLAADELAGVDLDAFRAEIQNLMSSLGSINGQVPVLNVYGPGQSTVRAVLRSMAAVGRTVIIVGHSTVLAGTEPTKKDTEGGRRFAGEYLALSGGGLIGGEGYTDDFVNLKDYKINAANVFFFGCRLIPRAAEGIKNRLTQPGASFVYNDGGWDGLSILADDVSQAAIAAGYIGSGRSAASALPKLRAATRLPGPHSRNDDNDVLIDRKPKRFP